MLTPREREQAEQLTVRDLFDEVAGMGPTVREAFDQVIRWALRRKRVRLDGDKTPR